MVVKLNVMVMILLWVGLVPLISSHRRTSWTKLPVCEAYNLPEKTAWITRTSCDEHKKFRCTVGQGAKVETVCKNGKWIEELACPGAQCPAGERFSKTDGESPLGILYQTYKLNCSNGATRNGSYLTVQCSTDGNKGRWKVINNCEDVLCPSSEDVINFKSPIQSGYAFGTSKSEICAKGYIRNGSSGEVTCSHDGRNPIGKWKIVIDCELVQCLALKAAYLPDVIFPDGIYKDVLIYRCYDAPTEYNFARAWCLEDGEWFEEPACNDCFERSRFNFSHFYEEIPAGNFDPLKSCSQRCQDNGNCTDSTVITSPVGKQYCYLVFESKVIYFGQDYQMQCVERCNTTSECVVMNHWKLLNVCVLFNQTDGLTVSLMEETYDDTMLDKGRCPFLL